MSPWIDPDSGEVTPDCPECEELRVLLAGAERNLRGANLQMARMAGDSDLKRQEYDRLPELHELFDYWRKVCGHPRSRLVRADGRFDPERFDAIRWALETYGMEVCRLAIYGASVTAPQRRGTKFDDIGKYVYKSAETVERYAMAGKNLRGDE